ncbi:Ff.00g011620.m01.CDS01 [Fusarium sp. VM40]|nr:Ff.00g011620.m01.CDS01 [Fusarium sp. VM40]
MHYLKQIVAVRRKAGLTRQEFFDYHFQVHGKISTAPSPAETPSRYFQTHLEDAAYHPQDSSLGLNASPKWAFSDDITELYFQSIEHLDRVFKSPHVRERVGPDGLNFSDLGASLPVTVTETVVPFQGCDPIEELDSRLSSPVAMYFIAGINGGIDDLVSGFTKCLQQFAATRVRTLISNVPVDLTWDPNAYFGSDPGRPVFDLVFTIHLRDKEAIPTVREAQNSFEQTFASQLNLENTWIAFGQRALIFDQDGGIEFDPARQPRL